MKRDLTSTLYVRLIATCIVLTVGVRTHFECGMLLKRYFEQIAMHAGAIEGKDLAGLPG